MELLPLAFLAGILTVLSPCALPLLPVVLGGTVAQTPSKLRATIIILALASSVLVFSLVLKASTALIYVDPLVWRILSGGIILSFGLITLFPQVWAEIAVKLGLERKSAEALENAKQTPGNLGAVLIGFALGPIFSSCSPTYALIVAVILPQSFAVGVLNLIVYIMGLSITLAVIALLGQKLVRKTSWALNPQGKFRQILGIIFIVLGLAIITGIEKRLETALLEAKVFDATQLERLFIPLQPVD